MKLKKVVLDILLSICVFFLRFTKIKQNQITFITLEDSTLQSDLKMIYDQLVGDYNIKVVALPFKKNTIISNLQYMFNTFVQLYYMYQSKLVIINNNNYVISQFKRKGVKVLQVWHATGAIKKFGNCLNRTYKIQNYDYILSTSDYWINPYCVAFNATNENIYTTGIPRIDDLFSKIQNKNQIINKYPQLKDKKVVLYAPTFRGNIYNGFTLPAFDEQEFINSLPENYVLVCKYHPLVQSKTIPSHERILHMHDADLYELFVLSDSLISDYSSIMLDYLLLDKAFYFYIPDVKEYQETVGLFIDFNDFTNHVYYDFESLKQNIQNSKIDTTIKHKFFEHIDNNNTSRVVTLIYEIMLENN